MALRPKARICGAYPAIGYGRINVFGHSQTKSSSDIDDAIVQVLGKTSGPITAAEMFYPNALSIDSKPAQALVKALEANNYAKAEAWIRRLHGRRQYARDSKTLSCRLLFQRRAQKLRFRQEQAFW